MTENQLRFLAHEETARHNLAVEKDEDAKIAETERSNLARETETNRANVAKETETHRANTVKEAETARHNKFEEGTNLAGTVVKGVTGALSGMGSLLKALG